MNEQIISIKALFQFPVLINHAGRIPFKKSKHLFSERTHRTAEPNMQNSSAFSVDSLMGKKPVESKANDLEKESDRKSAFSVAPPLTKREFHPPSVCNCQPCQQTAVPNGFTAISQSVAEPRFMSLQSMAGAVTVPAPVYLPKGKGNFELIASTLIAKDVSGCSIRLDVRNSVSIHSTKCFLIK